MIEKVNFAHTGVVEKSALVALAEEAAEKLKKEKQDIAEVLLELHRQHVAARKRAERADAEADDANENNSFWVVMALGHAMRELYLDKDVVHPTQATRSRLII